MRSVLVCFLSLMILFTTASAELVQSDDLVKPLDGSNTRLYALPMDDYTVHGDAPIEANFT